MEKVRRKSQANKRATSAPSSPWTSAKSNRIAVLPENSQPTTQPRIPNSRHVHIRRRKRASPNPFFLLLIPQTNTLTQVLRWSALGVGVFYGAYHQLGISAKNKMSQEKREWERKESLIAQAKAEWARQHPAQQPKRSGGT